ncbi:pectin lyase [Verticillium dahliae VdLs.17]|uniref:Pectin lyase n=1 Tax=Verticillium dahliae (strain VdLs.17 / ATCC MYA-4575 / FGSC 10137) TaxID=498257 RepID=G2XF02_VERDV|nr:pectin lyase [Verticillium dahliae VdLs.17]EGY18400.1 pectin lyase [Verticillium dahliae VdLs.17]
MRASMFLAVAVGVLSPAYAQVVGKAFGMAAGTTGGGSATPAVPADIKHTPRVILIDREFNFIGSEGTATSVGCENKDCPVSKGGQDYIGTLSCGDTARMNPIASVKYDTAGTKPMQVGSNKSLVGVGNKGVIVGKGLRIIGSKNIIIQNIHFTNINPKSVWGRRCPDAGQHGTTSGSTTTSSPSSAASSWSRAGTPPAVSPCRTTRFDGATKWSASCNGQHYWALPLHRRPRTSSPSRETGCTTSSGRAPHYGTYKNGATNGPSSPVTRSPRPAPTALHPGTRGTACVSAIGRACQPNQRDSTSGTLPAIEETDALTQLRKDAGANIAPAKPASGVEASVKANAGVGKINAGTTTPAPAPKPTTTTAAAPKPTATTPSTVGSGTVALWGQCGGSGWTGATTCAQGTCKVQNQWFSQCL